MPSLQFAKWTALLLAVSSNLWLLLWIVGPEDGNWLAHTALFLLYAVAAYLTCFGNYVEALDDPERRSHVTWVHHTFIALFTFSTWLMPVVYFTNILFHEPGEPPILPPALTQSADLIWILCMSLVGAHTPGDVALTVTMALATEEEQALLQRGANSDAPAPKGELQA